MSTKRGSLFAPKAAEASEPVSPSAVLQDTTPARQPADVSARRPYPKASTRQGKKAVTVYVEPETMKQLRRMLREEEDAGRDTTLQDLMIEAINALFAERGLTRLAS